MLKQEATNLHIVHCVFWKSSRQSVIKWITLQLKAVLETGEVYLAEKLIKLVRGIYELHLLFWELSEFTLDFMNIHFWTNDSGGLAFSHTYRWTFSQYFSSKGKLFHSMEDFFFSLPVVNKVVCKDFAKISDLKHSKGTEKKFWKEMRMKKVFREAGGRREISSLVKFLIKTVFLAHFSCLKIEESYDNVAKLKRFFSSYLRHCNEVGGEGCRCSSRYLWHDAAWAS